MIFARRPARSLLLLSSITLCACSDKLGIHQLVIEEGETEGPASCVLLTDDGSSSSGGGVGPFDSDDDYGQQFKMSGGRAKFWFFIRPEPGDEATEQLDGQGPMPSRGALALEIDIDLESFAGGAQRDSFATRDGVEHEVYTWAEGDCEQFRHSVPEWVVAKVSGP
jgi:hypothetical protein